DSYDTFFWQHGVDCLGEFSWINGCAGDADIFGWCLVPACSRCDLLLYILGAVARATVLLECWEQCCGCSGRTAKHTDIDGAVSAQCIVVDINLSNGSASINKLAMSHGPHVEGAAKGDDEIGVRDKSCGGG